MTHVAQRLQELNKLLVRVGGNVLLDVILGTVDIAVGQDAAVLIQEDHLFTGRVEELQGDLVIEHLGADVEVKAAGVLAVDLPLAGILQQDLAVVDGGVRAFFSHQAVLDVDVALGGKLLADD